MNFIINIDSATKMELLPGARIHLYEEPATQLLITDVLSEEKYLFFSMANFNGGDFIPCYGASTRGHKLNLSALTKGLQRICQQNVENNALNEEKAKKEIEELMNEIYC